MYERAAERVAKPGISWPAQQVLHGNAGYVLGQTTTNVSPGIQWSGNVSNASYLSAASLVEKP